MTLEEEINLFLQTKGVDYIEYIDISGLSNKENKGFNHAILIGKSLSPLFIKHMNEKPDYLQELKSKDETDDFHLKEKETHIIADELAKLISNKAYKAYSQSDNHILKTGFFNPKSKTTPLPHKTIALLGGKGWIGKNNLFTMPEYGSAISLCSVLTNAPIKSNRKPPLLPKCGTCSLCTDICSTGAIKGKLWTKTGCREDIIDVHSCKTCLQCISICPYTQKYMRRALQQKRI
ncbi:MAG: epoxyqueuosine reductase [Bacteroidales bacterium]